MKKLTDENIWEKTYKDIPLNKIRWRSAPATFFYQLINNKTIQVGKVLELGCGTGEKAVYLAKKGFKVIAVDISQTAIKHACRLARKEKVKIELHAKDATDLSFLKNLKFDFILDFANLHGIPRKKHKVYSQEIIKHIDTGGLFYLRCFSKRTPERSKDYFTDGSVDNWRIWYFSEKDILRLFGSAFKIIKKNKEDYKSPTRDVYFDEYLMKRL